MGIYSKLFGFLCICMVVASCSAPRSVGHRDYTRNPSRSGVHKNKRTTAPAYRPSTNGKTVAGARSEAVRYAKSLIGARYKYGGSDSRGFDCSGFTAHVMQHVGIRIPRRSMDQASGGNQMHWKNAQPGDLVFFGRGGRIDHVGLVTRNVGHGLYVIHSTSSSGVRIDEVRNHNYWSRRLLGAASYLDRPGIQMDDVGED